MAPPPSLPIETTTEIIHLATEDLVQEERHHTIPAHSPTNAFLLAASLVSQTWRSIAQLALLRNGLVTPAGVEGFLSRSWTSVG